MATVTWSDHAMACMREQARYIIIPDMVFGPNGIFVANALGVSKWYAKTRKRGGQTRIRSMMKSKRSMKKRHSVHTQNKTLH